MSLHLLAQLFATSAIAAGGTQGAPAVGAAAAQAASPPRVTRAAPIRTLNGFVENNGQWAPDVLFFAREGRIEATLFRSGLAFRPAAELPMPRELESEPPALLPPLFLTFEFHGAPAQASAVEGEAAFPTLHHFLRGQRSASDCRGFATVLLRDVAPGIDVRVRTKGGAFAYDLLVDPGADLAGFSIAIDGADGIDALSPGVLAMQTPAGLAEQRIGASWQVDPASGERMSLEGRFRSTATASASVRFGFDAPGWNPTAALVIDPSLVYATYIGGPSQELLEAMTVDDAGAVYLACWGGAGTPTTPGSVQQAFVGAVDAWVGKLSPDGKFLEWGTYLGGSMTEKDLGVAVDRDGTVVVIGSTWSSDFPTTPGTVQPTFAGAVTKSDIFVTRLDAAGSSIVWSTFVGGADYEQGRAVALFPSGDVLVTAVPGAPPTPYAGGLVATPGVYDSVYDPGDQMIFRMPADGSSISFLTFLRSGEIRSLAIDDVSNIYPAGAVNELYGVPVTPGAFKESMAPVGANDSFVAKMNSTGTQLLWATYVGGNEGRDSITGIAVDAAAAIFVTGYTDSDDLPITSGAFDATLTGPSDGYVMKLLPGGSGLAWSTYVGSGPFGGTGQTFDIAVDAAGNACAVGMANEPGWPTTSDAFQPLFIGPFPYSDATLTKFDAFGEQLIYSTWFGGDGTDYLSRVGLDANGDPHLALLAFSPDIPVTPGAYDASYGGAGDLVVAKFDLSLLPWRVLGGGLKGTKDTPNLAGGGSLTPGAPTRLSVRGAAPASVAWIVAGFSHLDLPLLGGTLVPAPDVYFPLPTGPSGSIDFTFTWPMLAPGTTVTFQTWVLDLGAPQFWSATNVVETSSLVL